MNIQDLEHNADRAASLLTSMANARRLMVLCHLLEGPRKVGDLAAAVGLSQSALSQHLARMRAQGLVEARRAGQAVFYSLAGDEVKAVLAALYGIYCTPGGASAPESVPIPAGLSET
jgi:DNA-binding transcriptional ArsR family regulator